MPFGLQAIGTFVGCLPVAGVSVFFHNGHLTRFGRLAVWAAVGGAGLALVVTYVIAPRLAYGA